MTALIIGFIHYRLMIMRGIAQMNWRQLYNGKFTYIAPCTLKGDIEYPTIPRKRNLESASPQAAVEYTPASEQRRQRLFLYKRLHKMLRFHRHTGMALIALGFLVNFMWMICLFVLPQNIVYDP